MGTALLMGSLQGVAKSAGRRGQCSQRLLGQAVLHTGDGPVDITLHAGRWCRPALPQQALADRAHGDNLPTVDQDRTEHAVARRADEALAVTLSE